MPVELAGWEEVTGKVNLKQA